jgi:hypothetical protein
MANLPHGRSEEVTQREPGGKTGYSNVGTTRDRGGRPGLRSRRSGTVTRVPYVMI